MSSGASTPPDGTRKPTGAAVAISRLADGQDALGDAIGEIARHVHEIAVELEGYGRTFGDAHGHRAAAERHAGRQLDLILGEVRALVQRVTTLEGTVGRVASRLAGAEMELEEARATARNGSHDGE